MLAFRIPQSALENIASARDLGYGVRVWAAIPETATGSANEKAPQEFFLRGRVELVVCARDLAASAPAT